MKLLANLNLFTKNVTTLIHQDNKNFTTLIHQELRQYKKLPLLIRPSKQYTKGAKTSVLKQCAILKFVILYIKYLLPVSLCAISKQIGTIIRKINACLKGEGGVY